MTERAWTVWVGGGEITANYITDYKTALDIYKQWQLKGYDDVHLEEVAR